MTTTSPMHGLPAARRRRLIVIGLLRASATTAVLVAAYYLLPLDHLAGVPLGVSLAAGLLVLTAMSVYQVRAIIKARYPAIRAIEALAATAPLFLLLFAATYYLMAQADLSNFNVHSLTRTDALYFTVTVFATVGFGDITATSSSGPPHRHRADDPRPGRPRPRDPRVPRSGPAWPPTTHSAAGDRVLLSARSNPPSMWVPACARGSQPCASDSTRTALATHELDAVVGAICRPPGMVRQRSTRPRRVIGARYFERRFGSTSVTMNCTGSRAAALRCEVQVLVMAYEEGTAPLLLGVTCCPLTRRRSRAAACHAATAPAPVTPAAAIDPAGRGLLPRRLRITRK